MALVPGDVVRLGQGEKIVVDVVQVVDADTGDHEDYAVLRDELDTDLEHPLARPVSELTAERHLDAIPGWRQVEHGVWEQADE